MAEPARLIIPVWGEAYVNEVLSVTLPAMLAPGNLPALCGMFEVEFIIVTEARLFDMVRSSLPFRAAERICKTRLVALDDLLTEVFTDYGMVLTYALFRGFADLGPRMTETYLLPFIADFVIADGSLRHLGTLMRQGKRIIHAPSFRVVAETVDPQLQALVDHSSCVLSVAPRVLAKLALANDVDVLGNLLDRLSERNRWYRDFTLEALSRAVQETIACFPVYRTYVEPGQPAWRERQL